jgi:hypothetical protein
MACGIWREIKAGRSAGQCARASDFLDAFRQTWHDRYGRVPPPETPLLAGEMELPELRKEQVVAHVLRQLRPVHAWVMGRASKYFDHGVKAEDCDWRACVDLIAWQRASNGCEAAEFVVELPKTSSTISFP